MVFSLEHVRRNGSLKCISSAAIEGLSALTERLSIRLIAAVSRNSLITFRRLCTFNPSRRDTVAIIYKSSQLELGNNRARKYPHVGNKQPFPLTIMETTLVSTEWRRYHTPKKSSNNIYPVPRIDFVTGCAPKVCQ